MKQFESKCPVGAKPMTRGEYNTYRGWTLPADEDGSDLGYLVQDLSDPFEATPNEAWIPEAKFERTHRPNGSWLTRLKNEHQDLKDAIYKLEIFLGTSQYQDLPSIKRIPLTQQLIAMGNYEVALRSRIQLEEVE
jgi:hypothetical protein